MHHTSMAPNKRLFAPLSLTPRGWHARFQNVETEPGTSPESLVRLHAEEAARTFGDLAERCGSEIVRAAASVEKALRDGGHFWLFGNGGSASDAQHIAAELAGRFRKERRALSATALTTNTSSLTAISNDYGYEQVFARQLEGVCRKGDVVLGITTSGQSKNVVLALRSAHEAGATTIALTGAAGRDAAECADIAICVPSNDTQRTQECHIHVGHTICELVEQSLFS